MPNDYDPSGFRLTPRQDLYRLTMPFLVHGQTISSGSPIALSRSGEVARPYLDGDVFSARVTLAPSSADPFTGTRWVLQQNDDGTWGFLNQGQPGNMLVASAGSVALGRPLTGTGLARFVTSRWLIYRDLTGFRLRPVMAVSGWLGVRYEKLILSEPGHQPGRWLYWDIFPLEDLGAKLRS
jgi:hypothetical protein